MLYIGFVVDGKLVYLDPHTTQASLQYSEVANFSDSVSRVSELRGCATDATAVAVVVVVFTAAAFWVIWQYIRSIAFFKAAMRACVCVHESVVCTSNTCAGIVIVLMVVGIRTMGITL